MRRFGKPATAVAQLRRDGFDQALTSSRWCLLKRPENLTDNQATKLAELLEYNLKSVRAHLLREEFQRFWEYASPAWAGKFLELVVVHSSPVQPACADEESRQEPAAAPDANPQLVPRTGRHLGRRR